jgi:hypothetical protein
MVEKLLLLKIFILDRKQVNLQPLNFLLFLKEIKEK